MTTQPFIPRKPKGKVGKACDLYPVLNAKLNPYMRNDFFFLNIGANDGISNDPIHPYLLGHPKWRGVAVEPASSNFEQLQYNYRNFPNVTLVNAAISDEKRTFYYLDEKSGCNQSWVSQISSFDKDYILNSLIGLRQLCPEDIVTDYAEEHIQEDASVACISLEKLIEEYAIEQVDFLNIDTEGSDFEILRKFDFERFKPTVMCIESAGFTSSEREYFEKIISDYQYRFIGKFGVFSEIYARG
jgi:FkbM family methyltransferase